MSNGNGNGDGTTHAELGLRGRVVVVGAGIAGLTAAHELVERGFEVEVVESDFIRIDLCDEEGNVTGHEWIPRIGGMARTQWVRPPEVAGDVELEEAPHDTSDSAIAFDSQPSGSENAIDPAQITDQVLAESVAYCQHPDSRMRVHYVDSAPEIQHRRAELAAWEAARDSFAPALALWRELAAAAQRKERGAKSEQERLRQELAEPTRELERALQHQHRLGPIQAEFALELDRVLTGIDEADASGDWRRQRRLERRKAELEARLGPLREELDRAADIIADRDPFVASRRDLLAAARGRADGSMTAAYGDKLAQLDDAVTKILVESVARERFQGTMNPDIRRDLECLFAPLRPGDANERIAALRDAYRGPLPPPDVEQELTRLLEVRGVLTQQRPTPGLAPVDYYDRLLQELKDLRYVPDPPTDERREWELLERFKVALPLFGHLLSPIHIADGTVARRVMKLVGCLDPTLTGDRLVTTYEVLDGSTQAASNTSEGPTGGAVVAADTATPAEGTVTLELAARTVPAEHGFRFYPSFYLHLFDTLSRIPLERGWEYREGRAPVGTPFPEASLFHPPSAPRRMIDDYRTVLQNLVPAKVFRFGLDRDAREIHDPEGLHRHRSWSANRRPPRTVAELREHFTNLLDDTGYSGESVARFDRRLVEYPPISEERRQDHEKETLKEFVKTEELDPRLRE
ncbi:MAG: FAD-dependent oxidoreductase, partial [Sandaracinaceae bacterium]